MRIEQPRDEAYQPDVQRRRIDIAQREDTRIGRHVGFVKTKPADRSQRNAQHGRGADDKQNSTARTHGGIHGEDGRVSSSYHSSSTT